MSTNRLSVFSDLDTKALESVTGGDDFKRGMHKFGRFLRDTVDNTGKMICKFAPWC